MVVGLLVAQPGVVAAGYIPHDPWKLAQGRALGNPTHATVVGECQNCHTLNSTEGEPNTSYINNTARTLGSYKMALGRAIVIGDNLGCTFCHSNQLDNTTMDDVLTDYEYTSVQHPIGVHVNGSNNRYEFLSTYGSATNNYQLQCVECHQQSLVTYPYHQGRTTDPGIWSGSWNKTINANGLTGVTNLASQGDKEHCLTCHGDLGAGNGPTKPKMGHLAWGNYTAASNTMRDASGQILKAAATASCTVCHDSHTSTKANLAQDGLDRGEADPGHTAIVESNCVAVCHEPGLFSSKGHGGKTGINATNCTPCHSASISHRDTTDASTVRRLGMTYPDTLMSNMGMNRNSDGLDNDMNGVKDDETNFRYSKVSICKTCHMHYSGHGTGSRVTSCLDCHDLHGDSVGSNVAMIRSSIFGEQAVFTQTERDAGTFFRSGATPNGVCDNDACHTTQTGGLATTHTAGSAPLSQPCSDCHALSHTASLDTDDAFKLPAGGGGCTICHGGGTTGSPATVMNYWPDGAGGADDPGRHLKHVEDLAARVFNETTAQLLTDNTGTALGTTMLSDVKQKRVCAYCHEDPLGNNFEGPTQNLHNNGTANVNGYLHQLWQAYAVDFAAADAAPTGFYDKAADTCATVDCHNNKLTLNGSYGWYDSAPSACTICHTTGDLPGDDAGTPSDITTNIADPVSGIHRSSSSPWPSASDPTISKVAHDDAFGGSGTCTTCHTAMPARTNASAHVNGALTANNTAVGAPEEYYTFASFTDAALNAGTCAGGAVGGAGCHDGVGDTGTWRRNWSTSSYLNVGETAANSECGGCHGTHIALWNLLETDGTTTDHTNPDTDASTGDLSAGFSSDHSVCKTCHGWGDAAYSKTWASGMHGDGSIEMNGPVGTGTGYNDAGGSAGQCTTSNCHGAAVLAMSTNSSWPVRYGDFGGGGGCPGCHESGTAGAPVVNSASSHTKANGAAWVGCEECHQAAPSHHANGTVDAVNNVQIETRQAPGFTVAVPTMTGTYGDQYSTHSYAIRIGGTATSAYGKSTEAEICWACHYTNNGTTYGEFGTNCNANTGGLNYNYGSLDTWNGTSYGGWVSNTGTPATWRSGTRGNPTFSYKDAALSSMHGANYAAAGPGNETAAQIRCSYCHDVHDTGGAPSGAPYLRGTWMGNPYKEDGAPRSGQTFGAVASWGAVPRASTLGSAPTGTLGGYWIDQNSATPRSTWVYTSTTVGLGAQLCSICHGTNINTLNQFGTYSDWVSGYNGHANSVRGGAPGATAAETAARNIFGTRGGVTTNGGNPLMHYQGMTAPGSSTSAGFRATDGTNYTPSMGGRPGMFNSNEWVADSTGSTFNSGYHKFPCSKCHNPHASRLPRLMITNCLDTKQNTWDDTYQRNNSLATTNGALNTSRSISNWTAAVNCHRRGGAGSLPAGNLSGTGAGWNNVTPW